MATTTLINGQSFGTGANAGNGLFCPTSTAIQSTTTAFTINVKIVLGNGQPSSKSNKLRVWFTSAIDTITAALAPEQLGPTATYVDVTLDRSTVYADSDIEVITGGRIYCWVDAPTQAVAGTVTVKLNELP